MLFRCFFIVFIFCMALSAVASDVRIMYPSISKSLDPYEQLSHETLRTNNMLFDPLIRLTKESKYEPRLAHKWKIIDENTIRFYLRNDVYFHSGKKLNVDDVIFTFQRVKKSAQFKGVFSPIEDVKAVDDMTFDMITRRSFPLTLNIAAAFFPMDSEFYSGKNADGSLKNRIIVGGDTYASNHVSGTGVFTVEEFTSDHIKFVNNNSYWDESSSDIDTVTITKSADDETRVSKLLADETDIINSISIDGFKKVRDSGKFNIVNIPGESLLTYLINFERSEGLSDIKIRQAINYAIDRDLLVDETMKDLATPAEQFSPPIYAGNNKSLKPRYNPEKARELIKEADFKGSLEFDMIAPDYRNQRISQMVSSMLEKVGIKINLKILPEDTYWDAVDNSDADIMMIGWYSDTNDSNNFFEFLAACTNEKTGMGKYNSGKYCNPEVDQLIQEANVILDPGKRARTLQKIEKKLYDDAMHLPLFWENVVWAAKPHIPLETVITGMDVPYFGNLIINEK